MTSRGRHRLVASVLLVAIGTACGGGGEARSSARKHAPQSTRAVVPATVSTTTVLASPAPSTSLPPHAPSLDPPPVVRDRGNDHVAIARSLLQYGRWLEWHPDRARVEQAYETGSALAHAMTGEVTRMRRAHRHIVEVDAAPFGFEVLSTLPNVVSFRLTEQLAHREVIDARGRVLRLDPATTEHYLISIMRFAPDAPWRLSVVERQGPPIEVQL